MNTMNPITVLALALAAGLAACQENQLQTRTFELKHLDAAEAASAVEPYVFADREDAPGKFSLYSDGITVRETEDNLKKIQRVLERLDRPQPSVRLRFQVIQANGAESDPRIERVRSLLEDHFRYEGYRLLEEVQLMATEGSRNEQRISLDGRPARIVSRVDRIRRGSDGDFVKLALSLIDEGPRSGDIMSATVTVRLGRTAVLGSSRAGADGEAIILTVETELADPESGPGTAAPAPSPRPT